MPRPSKADAVVTPFPIAAAGAEPLSIPRYAVTLMGDAIRMAIRIRRPVIAAWNGDGRAIVCPAGEREDLPEDMLVLGCTDAAGEQFHWACSKPKR